MTGSGPWTPGSLPKHEGGVPRAAARLGAHGATGGCGVGVSACGLAVVDIASAGLAPAGGSVADPATWGDGSGAVAGMASERGVSSSRIGIVYRGGRRPGPRRGKAVPPRLRRARPSERFIAQNSKIDNKIRPAINAKAAVPAPPPPPFVWFTNGGALLAPGDAVGAALAIAVSAAIGAAGSSDISTGPKSNGSLRRSPRRRFAQPGEQVVLGQFGANLRARQLVVLGRPRLLLNRHRQCEPPAGRVDLCRMGEERPVT